MADSNIEGRYINPLTDYGFKKVFGEKDIMIAFLTDLLNPKSPIEDIVFIDKDLVADSEEFRGVIYDLRSVLPFTFFLLTGAKRQLNMEL